LKIPTIELRMERMIVPSYTVGYFGNWMVEQRVPSNPYAEVEDWGYVTGMRWDPSYPLLKDEHGRIAYAANRMAREVGGVHLAKAHGTVVLCGVGMGLFLYNVVQKPVVQRVFVVDVDAALLSLVFQNSRDNDWPNMHKVEYLRGDPRDFTQDVLRGMSAQFITEPADYLYVDTWPHLGHPDTIHDFRHIVNNVKPLAAGFAGQELNFMDWATGERMPPVEPFDTVTLTNFDEWCLWCEGYMHIRSLDYLRYCLITWMNQKARSLAEEATNG